MDSQNSNVLLFFRVAVGSLLIFEFLNWAGMLHVPLDFSWQGLAITSGLGWLVVEVILRYKKNIETVYVLPFVVLIVYMDALGDILHFYSSIRHYDKFLHFTGSTVIAYALYESLASELSYLPRSFLAIIFISLGGLFWMLYEIEEYLEDLLVNHRLLRMGDSFDTGGDLLMDLLGCIFIILLLIYRDKNKPEPKGKSS